MDQRPVGIFDSGLGGLTGAKALETLLPGEDLVYFGDSANAPYGTRSESELLALARANTAFLLEQDVKAILVACGTVSSTVIDRVRRDCPVPMFDVVEAACAAAAASGAPRVAVTATEATVRSGAFQRRLAALAPEARVFAKPCQSLVAAVEAGHFLPGDAAAEAAVAAELGPVRDWGPDLVLLACTHFPLLQAVIAAYLGPGVRLLSVAEEAAGALGAWLTGHALRADRPRGSHRWYTSGSTAEFARLAGVFLGHPVRPERHVNT